MFSPSTNNSLERFNLTIKDKYLTWRRTGIKEFVKIAMNAITNSFKEKPILNKMIYQDEEEISVSEYDFIHLKHNENYNYYLVKKSSTMNVDLIIEDFHKKFDIFDDFHSFYSKIVFITCTERIESYTDVFCSCRSFSKNKKCKHVYNFLLQKKSTHDLKFNILNVKKSRGRPRIIKPRTALVKEE